ncbi:MAG: DNRLRE domain-containing protein [Candidatus Sumerlaeaceae bacterium]
MTRNRVVAVLFVLTYGVDSSTAATLLLEQGVNGYTGTGDTTIFQDRPNNSSGGFPELFSGAILNGSLRRTLIRFDLPTTLTSSAVITSVSLRLVVDRARPGVQTHTLRKVTRSWNEGNLQLTDPSTIGQGAASQPGDATWNSAADGQTSWTTAGGDFSGATSGSGAVDIAGTISLFTGAGMVQDVQSWLNGSAQNFGWVLLGNEASVWNAKRFVSSEGISGQRPQLTITFAPPTSAANWQLFY